MSPTKRLLSSSFLAFLLSYALQQLVLTRLFSPTEMGFADSFFSYVMPCAILVSGRFEDGFALTKNPKDALHLQLFTLLLAGLGSLFLGFLLFLSPYSIYALLFSLSIFFTALTRIAESIFSLKEAYPQISNSRLGQSLLTNFGQVLGGFFVGGAFILIVSQSLARIVSALFYIPIFKTWKKQPFPKWKEMFESAKPLRSFPLFSMPAALLNAVSNNLAFLMLPLFFDWAVIGQFGRAYKLLLLPLSLLMGAVGQVFYAQAPLAHQNGNLRVQTKQTLVKLAFYCFPICAVLGIFGTEIVPFILGETWATAGKYLIWIAPWLFFHALASPLTRIFDITHSQKTDLAFSLFMLLTQVAVLGYFSAFKDPLLSIQTFCVCGIVLRILQLFLMFKLTD